MTTLTAEPRSDRPVSDYATLMAEVQQARLLERSGLNYLPRLLTLGAMVSVGVLALVMLGNSWWQLGVAAYFAVVFAQLGFLGHDAGHQQIFRSRRWNDTLGLLISNLGVGLSYGWWVDKHNRHHRHPNDVDRDPDVRRNVLAWTPEQAQRQRGPLRFVARHQAGLFFPLLVLEAFSLHLGSVQGLSERAPRRRAVESALLAAHVAGCVALLLVVMPPVKALVFVVVQQALLGIYLGCSFAPNHKGMQMLDGASSLDFLRRQVLTARNVAGGRVLSAVFGALNYQIEHHLFPSMPSRNLRRCQRLVKRFCATHGVSYCETTLLGSYARALRYFRDLRPGRPGALVDAAR